MMKKVLFALAVLCTSFWSCNTLDLNDVGYGDGDRLKASSVKKILYGTADGCWKADYQGHEFYFQFHEDGTVTLDSDFLEMAVEGKTSFSAKGTDRHNGSLPSFAGHIAPYSSPKRQINSLTDYLLP